MKKTLFLPLAVLTALLICTLWNSRFMTRNTSRWLSQLQQAESAAAAENWKAAQSILTACYADWSSHQTYLHIVSHHDAVDDAEAIYHRCLAFSYERESSEFQAELADLQVQLLLLAEMEHFSTKNVL